MGSRESCRVQQQQQQQQQQRTCAVDREITPPKLLFVEGRLK
jgi:hypothetical protein